MAAEHVLRLLDSFWFETTILTNKAPSKVDPISQPKVEEVLPLDTKLLEVPTPTLEVRSYSDQSLLSTPCVFCDSPSPNSVLTPHKLRTIPSGREIREFSIGASENHGKEDINNLKKQSLRDARKTRKGRSLTELEFKELKGFMDLGFVFSEEDKDSKLVSLIPGLQRLGREDHAGQGDEEQQNIDETVFSDKPYLSEAWGVLDQRKIRNPLLNWRIPARGSSEIDMKHNLRFWAHTVASMVR
ncbi:hypothetical protein SESBI_01074 [Sesbania bispinosa]|nr:hypothetical protein SESBI_01074 [Sesbania bispinosa]